MRFTHVAQYVDPPWLYMGGFRNAGSLWLEFWKVPSDNSLEAYVQIANGNFGDVSFPFFQPVYPDAHG